MPEIREVLSTDATVMDAVVAVIGSSIFIHEILQSVGCKDIKQSEHDFVHARGHVHMTSASAQGGSERVTQKEDENGQGVRGVRPI